MTWSTLTHPQRLVAVRPLVASGTAKQAARALETTTSAIIGFCSRNKIGLGNTRPVPANDNTRPVVRKNNPPPAHETPAGLNVLLIDRADDGCCWPTTGEGASQRYCGLPTAQTYCKAHRKRMFNPRLGDLQFSEALMGSGRPVAPGITEDEAIGLVVGKMKMEGCE